MITAAVIRELVAAGLAGESLVAACERIEAADQRLELIPSARQARNRRYYEKRLNKTVSDGSDAIKTQGSPPLSSPPMVSLNNPSLPTPSDPPLSNSSTVAGATRRTQSDKFEEFWKAYPKREGANPKKPAKAVFVAKLKAGATVEEIVAGARACAVRDRDKIGTPYIPQAVKWLRDERWRDYATAGQSSAPQTYGWTPGKRTAAEILADFRKERTDGEAGKADGLEQGPSMDEDGPRSRAAEPELFRGDNGEAGICSLAKVLSTSDALGASDLPRTAGHRSAEDGMDGAVPVPRMAARF